MEFETRNRSVFDRLGGGPKRPRFKSQATPPVCNFWLSGECNRKYCRFLHPGLPKVQPSCDDHRRNKLTYSLKNDASEFGFNDVTTNKKQGLIANRSSLGGSKNDLVNSSVPSSVGTVDREKVFSAETSGSVVERKNGRIITLKKGSPNLKLDENRVNQKGVLATQRSGPVVQTKDVTASSSNIAFNSEAKSPMEKVLTYERPDPVVQSKSAQTKDATVPSPNRVTDFVVKIASEEELEGPGRAVQSTNVSVSSFNTCTKGEVISETPGPSVQSNNVPVSSSNSGTKGGDESDPADQKTGMTTKESCCAEESCENTGLTLCKDWVAGNCPQGDNCWDLHSWYSGSGFSLLTRLEKHQKAVIGITLPSGSDKLFSGDKDGSVCVWDCNSGQCVEKLQLEGEIGCMISEYPWVFVGMQNAIKAWNIESNTELVIPCPNGLVNAMVVAGDVLFAGVEDGSMLAWKSCPESNSPTVLPALKGHASAVISLTVGGNRLYSGSKDQTIRVWDIKTLECIETLKAHNQPVTSLTHWEKYLFSGSLDNSLKVWGAAENGNMEVIYERKQESGILALRGINNGSNKPILLCSCKDNIVRVYDLPAFAERGRTFSNGEVHTLDIGCGGLFFSGDSTGRLFVWKLD